MKKLQSIFKDFLSQAGALEKHRLGVKKAEIIDLKEETLKLLVDQLREKLNVNKIIIFSLLGMSFMLFGVGLFLIFYFLKSPQVIPIIYGGSFLSLTGIFKIIIELFRENNRTKDLLTFIPEIESKDVVRVIESLYYSDKIINKK